MASAEPWAGALAEKSCILAGAERVPGLTGLVATGRANAANALDLCGDHVPPNLAPVPLAPAAGARVRPKGLTFHFSPGADALSGVVSNTVILDGRAAASGVARAKVRKSTRLRDGNHHWLVRSTDRFGNSTDSSAQLVVIDGTGPRARLSVRRSTAARGVRIVLRLNEAASVTPTLKLARRTARSGRTRRLRKGTRSLRITLPRSLRKAARRKRVGVSLRLADQLGNATRKSFKVRLR
jgi:hypothetical protein